jgi:signal transduction histidine kinase/ActR/RegA family two-component response regulator
VAIACAGVLAALYFLSGRNYLLFHSLVETASVVVGVLLFTVAARMYGSTGTAFLILLGVGFFWPALVDFVHMLAYKGMGVFPAADADLPTQLWILARYIQVAAVLTATFFLGRYLRRWWPAFVVVGLITCAGLALVFTHVFPAAYVEGTGLTRFKVTSEYAISALWVVSLAVLVRRRRALDTWTVKWLAAAMTLTVASELAFTFYVSVYGLSNFIGHVFKVGAYAAVLVVIIQNMLVSMQRELEERRHMEEALRENEEQLRQAQKMEAIGRLAGGIAHDFNNLLTAVLGYSDLLLAGDLSPDSDTRTHLLEIKRAAERAGVLTKQILAFSRRQALRPTVVSLDRVVAGMEPILRGALGKDIQLRLLRRPDLDYVEIDVEQFEQVIMNLAVNAREAMALGGALTIETANVELDDQYCRSHPETKPGNYVLLAMTDTGIGMDEATLEHLFEPFFTTKAPGTGTGLGLATVYGIVKQSGGSVTVHSERGMGACFKIYLPRNDAPVRRVAGRPALTLAAHGQEIVLVVEDEPAIRSLAERVLGKLGYHVLTASSANAALKIADEYLDDLDLLLTDVVLPGDVQGNDLARELVTRRPSLPVLFMSGYPRDAMVQAGRLPPDINMLEKPFNPRSLATAVRAVLDEAHTDS